jgi:hypothetical protein
LISRSTILVLSLSSLSLSSLRRHTDAAEAMTGTPTLVGAFVNMFYLVGAWSSKINYMYGDVARTVKWVDEK